MHYDCVLVGGSVGNHSSHDLVSMRTLGVHKIGWVLRQHGYKVFTIGKIELFTESEIQMLCEQLITPKTVLGLSASFIKAEAANEKEHHKVNDSNFTVIAKFKMFSDYAKKVGAKIIMGGGHASLFKDLFQPDHIISGYAENSVVELMDKIKRHGIQKKPYDWDIKTCKFRWSHDDFVQPNEVLPIETARGCIFSCKFCTFPIIGKRKGTFERPVADVREELIYNYNEFGTTQYWFAEDTFNADHERMEEFCDMVETLPFSIKYTAFARLDLFNAHKSVARRLYESGMRGCSFGIETFHPKAAKAIAKSWNATQQCKDFLQEFYHDICDGNIAITTTNIIGLPFEPEESILRGAEWYRKADVAWASYIPFSARNIKYYQERNADIVDHLSDISQNPANYGITFPDETNPAFWKTDLMDAYKAIELYPKVKQIVKPLYHKHIDSWVVLHHLSHMNMSIYNAKKNVGWEKVYERSVPAILKMHDDYKEQLLRFVREQ